MTPNDKLKQEILEEFNPAFEQVEEEIMNDVFDALYKGKDREFKKQPWLDFKEVLISKIEEREHLTIQKLTKKHEKEIKEEYCSGFEDGSLGLSEIYSNYKREINEAKK